MLITIKRDRSWLDWLVLRAAWKRIELPADVSAAPRLWWAWFWRPGVEANVVERTHLRSYGPAKGKPPRKRRKN